MARTWVLVADEARARLFRAESRIGPLEEDHDFVNPAERLPEHELGADAPGRVVGPGGRQHAFGGDDGMREHESERFAAELTRRLKKGREHGEYERLYLVAPPKFLGALRKSLDAQTAALLVDSLDKDIVRKEAGEIRGHLPKRL